MSYVLSSSKETSTWSDQRGSFSAASRLFWKMNVNYWNHIELPLSILPLLFSIYKNDRILCFWIFFAFIFGFLMIWSSYKHFQCWLKTFMRVNCKGIFYSNGNCSSLRYMLFFYIISEQCASSVAEFIDLDWGNKVNSGVRVVAQARQATWAGGGPVWQPYAGVSGSMSSATALAYLGFRNPAFYVG